MDVTYSLHKYRATNMKEMWREIEFLNEKNKKIVFKTKDVSEKHCLLIM